MACLQDEKCFDEKDMTGLKYRLNMKLILKSRNQEQQVPYFVVKIVKKQHTKINKPYIGGYETWNLKINTAHMVKPSFDF